MLFYKNETDILADNLFLLNVLKNDFRNIMQLFVHFSVNYLQFIANNCVLLSLTL
jgi:hypothetical protein